MATIELVKCQWFAACDNDAVGLHYHSQLGHVPICQRCADRFRIKPLEIWWVDGEGYDDMVPRVPACEICGEHADMEMAEMFDPSDDQSESKYVHGQCGLDHGMEMA